MKNKINKTNIAAAIILSTTYLYAGCGADTTDDVPIIDFNTAHEENAANKALEKETDRNEEISANKALEKETDRNEENAADKALEKETDRNEESQEKNTANTGIYDNILAEYSDMVQNDFYENLRDSDTYESSFGEHIGLEIRTHKQDIYYALYDIDGNGTNELVIAGGENGFWNYDLYGYNGTKAVHIFPDMEFGYRTNFALCENGVIEVFYSGSAAESGTDYYKIGNDGFTPELVDSLGAVTHLEGNEPVFTYSHNGTEITEEEYNNRMLNYNFALSEALDWVQIQ